MKKIIIILSLFLLVGCGKIDKNVTYQDTILNYVKTDENKVSFTAFIQNTSNNNAKIDEIVFAVMYKNGTSVVGKKDMSINFENNKKIVVNFELECDYDQIDYIFVTPAYNKKSYEYKKDENSYQVISDFDEITATNGKIKIELKNQFNKEKFNMIELIAYDDNNLPICLIYTDKINKELDFTCDNMEKLNYIVLNGVHIK